VFGHGEAELGNGNLAVCQQAPFEIGIGPGTGDDPGPLGGDPVFLGDPGKSSIKPAGIRLRSSNACSSAAVRGSIGAAASNAFRSSGMAQPSSTPGSLLWFKSSVKVLKPTASDQV